MELPTTSICKRYVAECTKTGRKFCASKRAEKEKTHPEKPEKGKTRCVLGAGGDESGCRQVQTDAKSHCLNQREHRNHTTHRKRKPAETQCFRRFLAGAEGLGLGCRLGRLAAERHWRSLTPRHAPQAGLRAHLVANSYRTLTKKSGIAKAIPDFFGRGRRT